MVSLLRTDVRFSHSRPLQYPHETENRTDLETWSESTAISTALQGPAQLWS